MDKNKSHREGDFFSRLWAFIAALSELDVFWRNEDSLTVLLSIL